MPNYVFRCKKCELVYEELTAWDETGKWKTVKCPKCKCKRKEKLVTTCAAVVFGNPRGTSKADNFGYVAGYNMAQAQDERRAAEAASHMGASPYNPINDTGNDNAFDFGKL